MSVPITLGSGAGIEAAIPPSRGTHFHQIEKNPDPGRAAVKRSKISARIGDRWDRNFLCGSRDRRRSFCFSWPLINNSDLAIAMIPVSIAGVFRVLSAHEIQRLGLITS